MAHASNTTPTVSVVIPCLNEVRHIAAAVDALRNGTFARDKLEVLVVDGMSDDGTRDIVRRIAAADPRVRLLDNPARCTPHALNIGIRAARGSIIVRADAHARFPHDYVEVLVRTLDETGADLVGCAAYHVPGDDTEMAQAIALSLSGAFATASPFRFRRTSGGADTVPFGCWRRELFDRVGLFDERLLRNQDNEHASRILRAGGRIHLTAEARVGSVVRPTLARILEHAARGGTWNAFTQRLCPYTFRLRHFLPGPFFVYAASALSLVAGGVVTLSPIATLAGLAALSPYLAVNAISSLAKAVASGHTSRAPLLFAITFLYHLAYGFGVCRGWLQVATGAWRAKLGVPAPTIAREPAAATS